MKYKALTYHHTPPTLHAPYQAMEMVALVTLVMVDVLVLHHMEGSISTKMLITNDIQPIYQGSVDHQYH
jgi:hypothetical protein